MTDTTVRRIVIDTLQVLSPTMAFALVVFCENPWVAAIVTSLLTLASVAFIGWFIWLLLLLDKQRFSRND